MKVLLAENDKQAAAAIRTSLEMCGCQVVSAASAGRCLTIAQQKDIDLLLIDLSLPRPPGVGCEEVIRQLKDMHRDLKIVTMAGENTRELEHCIRRHGILCYLTKPVLPSLVRELVLHLRKKNVESNKTHQAWV